MTLLDATFELFSSQCNLADDICPAKSVDHPGANTQCQTISSNLEVDGFDLINESLTKFDKLWLYLPNQDLSTLKKSHLRHFHLSIHILRHLVQGLLELELL